jgi:hypothetical protein
VADFKKILANQPADAYVFKQLASILPDKTMAGLMREVVQARGILQHTRALGALPVILAHAHASLANGHCTEGDTQIAQQLADKMLDKPKITTRLVRRSEVKVVEAPQAPTVKAIIPVTPQVVRKPTDVELQQQMVSQILTMADMLRTRGNYLTLAWPQPEVRPIPEKAPPRIMIDDILRTVCGHFKVSKSELLSQRRYRSIVWPRQVGMHLAKQLTTRSLPEIGRRFGDRDHTTVLHALRKIEKLKENSPALCEQLQTLETLCGAPPDTTTMLVQPTTQPTYTILAGQAFLAQEIMDRVIRSVQDAMSKRNMPLSPTAPNFQSNMIGLTLYVNDLMGNMFPKMDVAARCQMTGIFLTELQRQQDVFDKGESAAVPERV